MTEKSASAMSAASDGGWERGNRDGTVEDSSGN